MSTARIPDGTPCTCPHDWRNTPPDLTAAGHQGPSIPTWTRLLTVKTCPIHGREDEYRPNP